MMQRRVLLLLDGVEPLQHGLQATTRRIEGPGVEGLVASLCCNAAGRIHGLVVLTSRLAVKDIAHWQDDSAPIVNVERLSDEAGAALLRNNGVWALTKS